MLALLFSNDNGGNFSSKTLVDFQQTTQHHIPASELLINSAVRTSNPVLFQILSPSAVFTMFGAMAV
jgi:hypothetical protein